MNGNIKSFDMDDKSKRVLKNTVFLYLRMLLILGVSLYTSRVILQVLGVTDFGIYNVVGGLTIAFVFFSSSLTNVTQRYLNFYLGEGDACKTQNIFNMSLLIYAIISVFVLVCIEIGGLWLLENKLVIPSDRMIPAHWVLHTTTLSLVINLVSAPYNSVLIARENMKLYAYVGIYEAVGKLIIVYALTLLPFDNLISYAVLFLLLTSFSRIYPILYCTKKYDECRIKYYWDKSLFKDMFGFTGWNTFGCLVYMINHEGMDVILNMFFGPAVNAAKGVANQVNNAINNFAVNFFTAVRPQIVKSYASKDYEFFEKLLYSSSKYSYMLLWLFCLPIFFRIDYVMDIWLVTPPEYASQFAIWILIYSLIFTLTDAFWCAIQAVGKISKFCFYGGIAQLLSLPLSIACLLCGLSPISVFICLALGRLLYSIVVLAVSKQYFVFSIRKYIIVTIYPLIITSLLSLVVTYGLNILLPNNFNGLILFFIAAMTSYLIIVLFIGIDKKERKEVIAYINKKIHKF